ncbi:NRDE family protein [Nocardia vaccinii]|uniref:NRDE family protein n=1 Tax=Nocardia vaccinii TaxID=1822 RepID=UPI000836D407|nr:NRDE family protein [Nocardia vaccinii]
MCLVLTGWRAHPEYRLIVAANRDEFYTRPTESMRWWPEVAGLLAGRDLGAPGPVPGTWLGLMSGTHRFAAVTNVRGPGEDRVDVRSRGALLMDFLRGDASPKKFLTAIAAAPDDYNGYNQIASDLQTLWWHSNRSAHTPLELPPGLHGLSNGALLGSAETVRDNPIRTDTGAPAWPKVRAGLRGLGAVIERDPSDVDGYLAVLADRTIAPDDELPSTGLTLERERTVSARFIPSNDHGTRCSTVLLVREDGEFTITERSFTTLGRDLGVARFSGRVELPD